MLQHLADLKSAKRAVEAGLAFIVRKHPVHLLVTGRRCRGLDHPALPHPYTTHTQVCPMQQSTVAILFGYGYKHASCDPLCFTSCLRTAFAVHAGQPNAKCLT